MYAIYIARVLNKSFSSKAKTIVSSLKCLQRNYKPKNPTSFDMRSYVKDDVVVFKFEKPSFFIAINIFAALQCAFWTYLGVFFFRYLDDPTIKFAKSKIWAKILEKEREYSTALCAFSIFFGWACLFGTIYYGMRSVRKITLHKDGKYITLITYGLPGYNTYKLPLSNMSSLEHRVKAKKYIPLKLKGKSLHYLIDVRGEFSNPTLFDFTVGVKRGF